MNFKTLVYLFFSLYFITGIVICKDYGINWDDDYSRYNGLTSWNYVFNHNNELLHSSERYHGAAMEFLLIGVEKLFNLSDSRDIFLAHHYVDFLFFFGAVVMFFAAAKIIFNSEKWALLACTMLVLSPRIFADSFFNSKDLSFLSAFVFAFYSLVLYIQKQSLSRILFHCTACAFAIDIRLLGIILIPISLFVILRFIVIEPQSRKKNILFGFLYLAFLAGFIILFWPILWDSPYYHFRNAYMEMKRYVVNPVTAFYFGQSIDSRKLPWHYIPVWVLITTPMMFSIFWTGGIIVIIKRFLTAPLLFIRTHLIWTIIAALCIGPVVMVIILRSVVYDGWRHLFFIYPFFILIAVLGLNVTYYNIQERLKRPAVFSFVLYLMMLLIIMINIHPYENTYFNFVALKIFSPIEKQFEMDYWGLSYKAGLEYVLLANPNKDNIKISVPNEAGRLSRYIIAKKDRERLEYVDYENSAYYITNHRWDYRTIAGKAIYELRPLGSPIMSVYKVDSTENK